jgi:hypothetical protein
MCDALTLQNWPIPLRSEEIMSPSCQLADKSEDSHCRDSGSRDSVNRTFPIQFVKLDLGSIAGHQAFPGATKSQLYSESRGQKDVDLPCLYLLEVSGGDFSLFSQLFLRHAATHPLPANIRAERGNSCPFFVAQRHDILHRQEANPLNDMSYREKTVDFYCQSLVRSYNRPPKVPGNRRQRLSAGTEDLEQHANHKPTCGLQRR